MRKVQLKPRATGASTEAAKVQRPELPEDHPIILQYQLNYVKHLLHSASERKLRLEDLMSRPGAKKWAPAKKAQMVRRLVTVNQTVEQCTAAIDELTKKLEQVVAQLKQQYVPAMPPVQESAGSSVENAFAAP